MSEGYGNNPSPTTPLDAGTYVDIYDNSAQLSIRDKFLNELAPDPNDVYDSSTQRIGQAFELICGINLETTLDDDGNRWTPERVIETINETRAFINTEVRTVLGLKGIMGEIFQALFYSELRTRSNEELEAYAALFRLNILEFNPNGPTYRRDLENMVIEFNYWVLERLRWWQWRDEVLFNKAGIEYQYYPGISIVEFESTEQIHLNGPAFYYPRVGSITQEFLLNKFHYFDLCHTAGVLALMTPTPLVLTTNSEPEFLANLIISMLEFYPNIDPRGFLTPFGPRRVHNAEENEYSHNFSRYHPDNDSIETLRPKLIRAAYDAGVSIYVCDINDDIMDDEIVEKPTYALASEVMAQYMSPQFYTGVEGHRNYLSTLKSYKSLSGKPITEFKNYELLFYGVGDGTSYYRFYTWRDLYEIFYANLDFVDPYSVSSDPERPERWSRFSKQSIRRLQRVILPSVLKKTVKYPELNHLISKVADLIVDIMKKNEVRNENFRANYQKTLLEVLQREVSLNSTDDENLFLKENVGQQITEYFTNLYNIGAQFSDWEENFQNNPEKKAQYYQEESAGEKGYYAYLPAEYHEDLHDKIFTMVTHEVALYSNIHTPSGNLKRVFDELRIVRDFGDRFCTSYEDELESISGRLYLIMQAANFGYFDFIRTSGNWLMSTAYFYQQSIFEKESTSKMVTLEI